MPRKYTEEVLQAAVQAVKNGKGMREAGRLYSVPPSTIKERLKGRRPQKDVPRTIITAREEDKLVAWIKECSRRGFGRSAQQVRRTVQTILNQRGAVTVFKDNLPGRKWVSLFFKRHSDISFRMPQALGAQRAAVTVNKIQEWFAQAHTEISAAGGVLDDPSRIFNCDETGFQLGGGGFTKVIASKGERVYQVTNDTHTQITVLACVSASGGVLNPLIIFPGKRFAYNPLEGFPEAHFAKSESGWIDSEIFATWVRTVFIPATAHLEKPIVLFLDGHRTHLSMPVCDICRDNGIILYQLPSHSSHIIQPLDLTTFKPLKKAWREEVMKFQEAESDTVGKRDFAKLLKVAWQNGIRDDVVISGFRASGIYPWNPEHVDMTKLAPSRLYETEETDTATTSAEMTETASTSAEMTETATTSAEMTETGTISAEMTETASTSAEMTKTATTSAEMTETASTSADMTETATTPAEMTKTATTSAEMTETATTPAEMTETATTPAEMTETAPLMTDTVVMDDPEMEDSFPSYHLLPPLTPPPIITPELSHVNPPSATASAASTAPQCLVTSRIVALDRLLDIVAKAGVDKLIDYRTTYSLGAPTVDPKERLFCLLYSKLIQPTEDKCEGTTQDNRTFDDLPLPTKWTQKRKRPVLQPPKMVSSEAFQQYLTDIDTKKRKIEEDKEQKKKEREEKKKRLAEEREKKKKQQEMKKREREEKKAAEKKKSQKGKSKTKKRQTDDTSDNDSLSLTSSKCVESDSGNAMIIGLDEGECSLCHGENDSVYDDWVGCECGRWFHIGCVSVRNDSLRGKSLEEIRMMTYICEICEMN